MELSGSGLIWGLMPVYIEKSGDLVGCYHSGTNNEKGKIELLSHIGPWKAEISKKGVE